MSSRINRDDVEKFFEFSIHIPHRTLYMGSETDAKMAERIIKGMHLLEGISKTSGITIVMHNYGGFEYDGLAIYDAIAMSKCHVTVVVYGAAMSMGSWILQAADERVMAPRATLMIHNGSDCIDGPMVEIRSRAKEFERLTTLMEETYLRRMREKAPKVTLARLRKLLAAETYMTAQEAETLGLADRVLGDTTV